MFKLVVLSCLLAAAVAEPGLLVPAPLTYSSTYVSPATTTISQQASSVVHPSPLYYSTGFPYAHLIKKRSAPLIAAPYYASTIYSPVSPYLSTPLAYTRPVVAAPVAPVHYTAPVAHLIKKRSVVAPAFVAPSTYIAPATYAAAAPLYTTAYSTPYFTAASPYYYSPYLIKK